MFTEFVQVLPQLRFEWTITLGQIALSGILLALARPFFRLYKILIVLYAEHELLKQFVCKHEGLTLEQFNLSALAFLKQKGKL